MRIERVSVDGTCIAYTIAAYSALRNVFAFRTNTTPLKEDRKLRQIKWFQVVRKIVWLSALLLISSITLAGEKGQGDQREAIGFDLDVLEQKLEASGWRVERTDKGDLELWPPIKTQQDQPPGKTRTTGSGDVLIELSNLSAMQSVLRKRGWEVREEEDGSLIFQPLSEVRVEDEKTPLGDLHILLKAAGWSVEKTANGSLLLFPGQEVVFTEPEVIRVPVEDLEKVRAALEGSGWRVHRDKDGSLVVLPAAKGSRPQTASKEEVSIAESVDMAVDLPVDNESEVRKIAVGWLQTKGLQELQTGKIRKIHWTYVVSIVEREHPYRLRHQIAVRQPDGKVIPLN